VNAIAHEKIGCLDDREDGKASAPCQLCPAPAFTARKPMIHRKGALRRRIAPTIAAGLYLLFHSALHAQELKQVRIGYPAFSLTFLTFFVAKDAGIYKKHGLEVDMVQMAGAVQTSALVAGEIDYLTGITSRW
jgi:hypothetical protein